MSTNPIALCVYVLLQVSQGMAVKEDTNTVFIKEEGEFKIIRRILLSQRTEII